MSFKKSDLLDGDIVTQRNEDKKYILQREMDLQGLMVIHTLTMTITQKIYQIKMETKYMTL